MLADPDYPFMHACRRDTESKVRKFTEISSKISKTGMPELETVNFKCETDKLNISSLECNGDNQLSTEKELETQN